MDDHLYKGLKDLEMCDCGSTMFTVNIKDNLIICNRCLYYRVKPISKTVAVKNQAPPKKKKIVLCSEEKKIRAKYNAMANRSSKAGRECCSYEDFKKWNEATPDECYYCGGEFVGINARDGATMSIDRKDNKIGYLVSNMVKACCVCNSVKNQYLSCGQMKAVAQLLIEMRK